MIKQWSEFAKGAHGKGCTAASGNLGTCCSAIQILAAHCDTNTNTHIPQIQLVAHAPEAGCWVASAPGRAITPRLNPPCPYLLLTITLTLTICDAYSLHSLVYICTTPLTTILVPLLHALTLVITSHWLSQFVTLIQCEIPFDQIQTNNCNMVNRVSHLQFFLISLLFQAGIYARHTKEQE